MSCNASVDRDLAILARADRYNEWLRGMVLPYCRGSLLEIGAGIGNHSPFFLARCEPCVLSDSVEKYCKILQDRFGAEQRVRIQRFVLGERAPADWTNKFDTIVLMNVLEHIADDVAAVRELAACLRPGGRLVMVLPACRWLKGSLDAAFGHYRRYDRQAVRGLAASSGLVVERNRFFNLLGVFGWMFRSHLAKGANLDQGQVTLFNKLVPVLRAAERLAPPPIGLSLQVVLLKAEATVPGLSA